MQNIITLLFILFANITFAQSLSLDELIKVVNNVDANDSTVDHYFRDKKFQRKQYSVFYVGSSLTQNHKIDHNEVYIARLYSNTTLKCKNIITFSTNYKNTFLSFRKQIAKCGFKFLKKSTTNSENKLMNREVVSEYLNDSKYLELSLITLQSVEGGVVEEAMTTYLIRVTKRISCH
jgi:hypothetical protein